ncbi:hypothetical protein EVAR_61078_1 [Eumeta japonica]|uniref:Uncharacterized protein n=1 Tax=Eumeta variegata TaxID=151549 RepID=A0A4C1YLL7_EUMVA|nr:hypothetical protein EVAR_61078_1 [Eumeta japonica]
MQQIELEQYRAEVWLYRNGIPCTLSMGRARRDGKKTNAPTKTIVQAFVITRTTGRRVQLIKRLKSIKSCDIVRAISVIYCCDETYAHASRGSGRRSAPHVHAYRLSPHHRAHALWSCLRIAICIDGRARSCPTLSDISEILPDTHDACTRRALKPRSAGVALQASEWALLQRIRNATRSATTISCDPLQFQFVCSSVAIGRLRFSPLGHPFSLLCYCVSVFLRAAFRSVGLRACMSVWGAAQCVGSRAAAVKSRASVPATHSGDPAVCTPSPRSVSAPRERSRSFRAPDTDHYFSYFVCFTRVNGLPLTTATKHVQPAPEAHGAFLYVRAEIRQRQLAASYNEFKAWVL